MKKIVMLCVLAAAMIFAVSCATAPKKGAVPEAKARGKAPESEYREAKELRAKISEFDLARHAKAEYDRAEASFMAGEAAFDKDNDKARASFKDAISGYKAVIKKGFPAHLDEKTAVVERIKKSAEDLKAPVAMKNEYGSAKAVYEDALKSRDTGDFEKASMLLDRARDQFQSVYDITLAKKERAERNLGEAKAQVEELEAAAAMR